MKQQITYNIKNLHCGGCAAKVEEAVNKLDYIKEANINFMKKTLFIELKEGKLKDLDLDSDIDLLIELNRLADKIEPGTIIEETNLKSNKLNSNKKLNYLFDVENLHCGGCASKIESAIKNLDYVKEGTLNFMKKSLKVELNIEVEDLEGKLHKLADKLEPGTIIKEVKENKNKEETTTKLNHIFMIENLHCGGCASKIEVAINELEYIKSANLNFMKKSLKVELINNKENLLEELNILAEKLEPGTKIIEVIEDTTEEYIEKEDREEINEKKSYKDYKNEIKILVSLGLFFIGTFGLENNIAKLIVFIVAYILSGKDVIKKSFQNISRGNYFDENFLMMIATIGAFAIGEHSEAVGVMIFYQIGEYFQGRAVNNSRKSIEGLMNIRPDFANIKLGERLKKVKPESVKVGSIIVVKPGEKIPLDGIVTLGNGTLDTSALTGESLPTDVKVGDKVLSGSINKNGVIEIKVEKDFYNSTVNKILELVENASNKKAETEKFITKFAKYYTPIVVVIALVITFVAPALTGDFTGNFSSWLYRALIFLVISCPCALVISIPLGFFSGIGSASKKGILIKGGNYLEALNKVKVVVFDKTGTITKGNFKVTNIITNHITEEELLSIAGYGESYSNHPIAKSIVEEYKIKTNKNISQDKITNYKEIEGYGVSLTLDSKEILLGNYRLMKENNIICEEGEKLGTLVYVAVNKQYKGHLVISDELKEDSIEAIKSIKALGIKTYMLTGDNEYTARNIAEKVGIDEIYGGLLPDQKVEKFEEIKSKTNGNVIFVGDGINDAPVLARADVGVAMGGIGSDAAIEAADMVIMTDELTKLGEGIRIANITRAIVMQNIIFALGIKLIVMAMGVFGDATMWEAIFSDMGVSIIAIFNSIRILKKK